MLSKTTGVFSPSRLHSTSQQSKRFLDQFVIDFWCPANKVCGVFGNRVLPFSYSDQPREMAIAVLFWDLLEQ